MLVPAFHNINPRNSLRILDSCHERQLSRCSTSIRAAASSGILASLWTSSPRIAACICAIWPGSRQAYQRRKAHISGRLCTIVEILSFLPPPIAGFSYIVTNTRSGRQLEVYHRQNIYIWPTRPNLIHWARGMRRSWRATITITNKTKLPDLGETYVPTQTALHWPC